MANIYGHVIYNIYWHLAIGLLLQNEMVRIYMKYVVIGYNLVLWLNGVIIGQKPSIIDVTTMNHLLVSFHKLVDYIMSIIFGVGINVNIIYAFFMYQINNMNYI